MLLLLFYLQSVLFAKLNVKNYGRILMTLSADVDNGRVRNLKFARNLKFTTSKILVNFMKKMMFLSKNWYFSVQKALIYYTFYKSHHDSFILLVFSHVANFRYVANFGFLTLQGVDNLISVVIMVTIWIQRFFMDLSSLQNYKYMTVYITI